MSTKVYDVVALGELLIDFTQNGKSAQGNGLFEANPGGAPCNVLATFYRNPGADMMLTADEVKEELVASAKIFHFGTLSMTHEGVREATKKALRIAKEAGALISFDSNLREPLWKSLDEAKEQVLYGIQYADILNCVLEHGLCDLIEEGLKEMLTFANAEKGALKVMPHREEIERLVEG